MPDDRTAFIVDQTARALAECQRGFEPEQASEFTAYIAEALERLAEESGLDPLSEGRGLAAQYARRYARWKAGDLQTAKAVETSRGRWRRAVARS